jgi:flagellar P-ring protein precursor FlgI
MQRMRRATLLLLGCLAFWSAAARAERVETLATIKGTRPLRVMGTGIVVGLNGTGDQARAARKALQMLLSKEDINVDQTDLEGQNVAIVKVVAELPAFSGVGTVVDAHVASIYDAESLENGMLLTTMLRARPDGEVFAVASGRVLVGGEGENNKFLTTGSLPSGRQSGAQIVRSRPVDFLSERNTFELRLRDPSFTNAQAIAYAINTNGATNPDYERYLENLGFEALDMTVPGYAQALDAGSVIVQIPDQYLDDKVKFISTVLKDVFVDVDEPPRVVINRAKNTVTVTGNVTVGQAAISHGDLTVMVERPEGGGAGVLPRFPEPEEEQRRLVEITEGEQGQNENLRALLNTLNAMQARPRDVAVILEQLHRAGALHAELILE